MPPLHIGLISTRSISVSFLKTRLALGLTRTLQTCGLKRQKMILFIIGIGFGIKGLIEKINLSGGNKNEALHCICSAHGIGQDCAETGVTVLMTLRVQQKT